VIDAPWSNIDYAKMPATMQRWAVVDQLLEERGAGAQVALVDADTMIRWDTPDIFARACGFTAVVDPTSHWIFDSISAFQPLFPGTTLPWWEYFNAGLVVLGAPQRRVIRAFLEYSVANWQPLDTLMKEHCFGTDQTPLNFFIRRANEPVSFLPRPFNFTHCFPIGAELHQMESHELVTDPELVAGKVFARPASLRFISFNFVWHFTNVVALRSVVMRETWRRVQHNYPGVSLDAE
jgi:hypothetical protein